MKAIIFDFGNVVGFFDHYRALGKLQPFTSITPQEMYHTVFNGGLEDRFESGLLSIEEFLEEVRRACRLECPLDFLENTFADIFWPNPEVIELIEPLKKYYRVLLGSNTNAMHAKRFLHEFGPVLAHFHDLVLSFQIGVRKPKPGFFEACRERAGCGPEECLFVDDLPANIAGAEAAGLKGLVYRPGEDLAATLRTLGYCW